MVIPSNARKPFSSDKIYCHFVVVHFVNKVNIFRGFTCLSITNKTIFGEGALYIYISADYPINRSYIKPLIIFKYWVYFDLLDCIQVNTEELLLYNQLK